MPIELAPQGKEENQKDERSRHGSHHDMGQQDGEIDIPRPIVQWIGHGTCLQVIDQIADKEGC